MTERAAISDWDRVVDRLRAWAEDATVTVEGDHARVNFGNAHFTVYRDGRVDAGMPLHDVDTVASELIFESEAVHVQGDGLEYTFRRP